MFKFQTKYPPTSSAFGSEGTETVLASVQPAVTPTKCRCLLELRFKNLHPEISSPRFRLYSGPTEKPASTNRSGISGRLCDCQNGHSDRFQ